MATILITAATGQVGRVAMDALVATGAIICALVRRPAEFVAPNGVQVFGGSFEDDASLIKAMDGIDVMLLAGRDSPDSTSQHRRVLAHASRAKVRHIVKLSAIGASVESPVGLMREHFEVDLEIINGPIAWTLLRPHLYMQNLLRAADAVRGKKPLSAPMGGGRFPLVDTRDVGEAAAAVIGNPTTHAGKTYSLSGPDAVSYDDVAAALSLISGHEVHYEPVDSEAYQSRLLAAGMPRWRAFDLAHIASAYGADARKVSPDLARLLGRKPRSLSEFLGDHRGAFISGPTEPKA